MLAQLQISEVFGCVLADRVGLAAGIRGFGRIDAKMLQRCIVLWVLNVRGFRLILIVGFQENQAKIVGFRLISQGLDLFCGFQCAKEAKIVGFRPISWVLYSYSPEKQANMLQKYIVLWVLDLFRGFQVHSPEQANMLQKYIVLWVLDLFCGFYSAFP